MAALWLWMTPLALADDPKADAVTLRPFTGAQLFIGEASNRLVLAGSWLATERAAGLRLDVGASTPLDPATRESAFQSSDSGIVGGFQTELALGWDSRGPLLRTPEVNLLSICARLDLTDSCTKARVDERLAAMQQALDLTDPAAPMPCAALGLPESCARGDLQAAITSTQTALQPTVADPRAYVYIGLDGATTYDRHVAAVSEARAKAGGTLVGQDDYNIQAGLRGTVIASRIFAADLRVGWELMHDVELGTASYCPPATDGGAAPPCEQRPYVVTPPKAEQEAYVRVGLTVVLPRPAGTMNMVPGLETRFNFEEIAAAGKPALLNFRGTLFLMPINAPLTISVGAGVDVDVALEAASSFGAGEVIGFVPFGFVGGSLSVKDRADKVML